MTSAAQADRRRSDSRDVVTATAADSGSGFGPRELGFLLGQAHRARRRAWEAGLSDLGLTGPQAAVLRAISAAPGAGIRQLARLLITDPMNVQRLAESLTAAGLCELRRDPADARRRPIYPTDRGKRLAATVGGRATESEQDLVTALGASDYEALRGQLQRLLEHDLARGNRADIPDSSDAGRRVLGGRRVGG